MAISDDNRPWARRPLARVGVVGVGFAGLVLSACSASSAAHTDAARARKPSTTTPAGAAACPLSGLPAPAGGVPERPAMAVKIDNYPAARPQSGLDKADVVFEEPVEGGITRYAAVFQCNDASLIGPVRSARNIDVGILGQLGNPLLAHVGGINPVIANIVASPIVNVDIGLSNSLMIHPAGKVPPDSDYTSTALMYGTHPAMKTAPQPLFTYSSVAPAGSPVSSVNINYSSTSNVTWKYNPSLHAFQRFYNGTTPDLLADGNQNAAANVVVQYVQTTYGPWLENNMGGLEVQADLYPDASGTAVVYRDGVAVPATWHRSTLGSPTQFVDGAGNVIPMQPGQTWVEIVPNTIIATTTP
jgi:hypothetical protein